MNAYLKTGLLAALLAGGTAVALEPGATRTSVIAELGSPTGLIRAGQEETLYYERGHVQLKNGKVVDFEIISPEQLRERQAAAEKARVALAARTAEYRARLKIEGEAALKTLLADTNFTQLSAAVQAASWREFMKKYPDVPVTAYYLPALKRFEEEQARAAQEQRLAALEQRVQDAEQRVLMGDIRKMQYPDYYLNPPLIYYPPAYRLPGSPQNNPPHDPPHGPTRDAAASSPLRVYQGVHLPAR